VRDARADIAGQPHQVMATAGAHRPLRSRPRGNRRAGPGTRRRAASKRPIHW